VMAAQPVRPALMLLLGRAACMAASCCTCMAWGIVPPRASMAVLVSCVWAHAPVGAEFAVRGGDLSCKAETSHARRRLVVQGVVLSCEAETSRARRRLVVGVPLARNWSKMQPTVQRLDVLPVWVLTRVLSPPCPESLPRRCRSWPSHCQWCWIILCFRGDNLTVKGDSNPGPRHLVFKHTHTIHPLLVCHVTLSIK
jgi:hypothetical protein